MRTIIAFLLLFPLNSYAQNATSETEFTWPGGKKAAVCLTYDDGIDSHLEIAIPDLEAAGYRGTFYLTGRDVVPARIPQWRKAAARGHELGNHSAFHPCSSLYDWVPEFYGIEEYTFQRIFEELKLVNNLLFAIDGKTDRTYGYPCHVKVIKDGNYVDTLSRSTLFTGARNGDIDMDDIPGGMGLNIFDIPSMTVQDEVPIEKVKKYILHAIDIRSAAVFCFHGVGGDYIVTSREYHQEILDFLKEHQEDIWVTTMVEMTKFLEGR